jgi:DNA-binding CsgD family transcriptional regulator
MRKSASKSVLRLPGDAASQGARLDDARRRLLADWCRLVGDRLSGKTPDVRPPLPAAGPPAPTPPSPDDLGLSPRLRDILDRLLQGDSEKQIAGRLGISPHTVHTHVKKLHKTLNVSSRGELLAKFVTRR